MDRSRIGRRAARKGADYERQVARELTEATGVDHIRNLDEMRDPLEISGGDVVTRGANPLSVQCKVGVRVNPWKAYEEAVTSAENGQMPVAIVKLNQRDSVKHAGRRGVAERVVISKLDFYKLLVEAGIYAED